jgi:hypothetical protein
MAKDADEWLNMFVSTAEAPFSCIAIISMTSSGVSLVVVNSECVEQ